MLDLSQLAPVRWVGDYLYRIPPGIACQYTVCRGDEKERCDSPIRANMEIRPLGDKAPAWPYDRSVRGYRFAQANGCFAMLATNYEKRGHEH